MSILIELPSEELRSIMKQYQEDHLPTSAIEALDSEIEQRTYEQLVNHWENGWDYCTAVDFFGDRGTSILIQNTKIDWQRIWDWLVEEYSALPDGAMINFEVWDNIRDDTMVAGDMMLRRLILSSGLYAEITQ